MVETRVIKDFRKNNFICGFTPGQFLYFFISAISIFILFKLSFLSIVIIAINRVMIWLLCQVRSCGLSFIQYLSAMINTFRYSYRKKEGMADKLDGMGDTVLFNDLFSDVFPLNPTQNYYLKRSYDQYVMLNNIQEKLQASISKAFKIGSYTELKFSERVSNAYSDIYTNISMVNELLKRISYDCPYDQIDCITHENDKMLGELEELVLEVNDIVISNSFKPHQNDDIQKLITECKYYKHKT